MYLSSQYLCKSEKHPNRPATWITHGCPWEEYFFAPYATGITELLVQVMLLKVPFLCCIFNLIA